MKYFFWLFVLSLSAYGVADSGKSKKTKEHKVMFSRGLEQVLASVNEDDKKILQQMAALLKGHNFPLAELTGVRKLESSDGFLFIVNPLVVAEDSNLGVVSAISYCLKRKGDESYQLVLCGKYEDSYDKPAQDSEKIIALVDRAFQQASGDGFPSSFTLGLKEIAKFYYIKITPDRDGVSYKVYVNPRPDVSGSFETFSSQIYKVDGHSQRLELEASHISFFPSPAMPPVMPLKLAHMTRTGVALTGKLLAKDTVKNTVSIQVKKLWLAQSNAPYHPDLKIGEVREFSLRSENFSLQPGHFSVSPLQDSIDLSEASVDQDILLVGDFATQSQVLYSIFPINAKTTKKMDMFFVPGDAPQQLLALPAAELYAYLGDRDLQEWVLDAMCARHLLAPQAFLLFEPDEISYFGFKLSQCLAPEAFDKWLAAMNLATRNAAVRLKLAVLAGNYKIVSAKTRFDIMRLLDVSNSEQRWTLEHYLANEAERSAELKADPSAEQLLDLRFAVAAANDSAGVSNQYQSLGQLIEKLPNAKQIQAIKRVGRLVNTTQHATRSSNHLELDLYDFFIAQVKRMPSSEYLAELGNIDLSLADRDSQFYIEGRIAILAAGLAIAEVDPSSKLAVVNILQKWASDEAIFNPAVVVAFNRESPQQRKLRWDRVVEQFKALSKG